MSPRIVLAVMIRMVAVLLLVSAIGFTSMMIFGHVDPSLTEITIKGEAAIWNLAGKLLPAGVLWIYASELSGWLIGSFDRPLAVGLRAGALITAAINCSSLAVSFYYLIHKSELESLYVATFDEATRSIEEQVVTIAFFALAVALIFAAPKIDELITDRETVRRVQEKIKSEES